MNHVKCGRCVRCGREYPAVPNLTNCECGGILDIIYDYDRIRTVLTRETLKNRTERSMWRYRELLPVEPETPAPRCASAGRRCMRPTALQRNSALRSSGSRTTARTPQPR